MVALDPVSYRPVPSSAEAQLDRMGARLDERLRAVEQSCARLEGKMDMVLRLRGGGLPKWWHTAVAAGAALVALLGLWPLVQPMSFCGP